MSQVAGIDDAGLAQKIALLARPDTHQAGETAVETVETHMSLLFFAGDVVYKLKKPVTYDFLDFGTPAARRHACREELRLNRRLADGVYLGLSAITREADGTLALDGRGEPVDWLVRMRRLPADRTLEAAIARGEVAADEIAALAARLCAFYAGAERSAVDADAYVAQLRREHAANCAQLAGEAGPEGDALLAEVQRFLDADDGLLRDRVAAGRIVDGHGDLRPEHVWLNTPPVVIDCLEFNARLRQVDPFDEVAYLGMECARLGAPWIGPRLLAALSAALGDQPPPRLLRFYVRYRACVRARLALAHLAEPSPRDPQRWPLLARAYLRVGAAFDPLAEAAATPPESARCQALQHG